jgi:hypothetical protein
MTEEQDPKMGNGIAGFFDRSSFFAIVLLLLILIVSLYVVVAPHPVDIILDLQKDQKAPANIYADFDFEVEDLQKSNELADKQVAEEPDYYRIDQVETDRMIRRYQDLIAAARKREELEKRSATFRPEPGNKIQARVENLDKPTLNFLLGIADNPVLKQKLDDLIENILREGVLNPNQKLGRQRHNGAVVKIIDPRNRRHQMKAEKLFTPETAARQIVNEMLQNYQSPDLESIRRHFDLCMKEVFGEGNLSFDQKFTDSRKQEIRESVGKIKKTIHKNVILLPKGKIVSEEDRRILSNYRDEQKKHGGSKEIYNLVGENLLFCLALIVSLGLYLFRVQPIFVKSNIKLWQLGLVIIAALLLNRLSMDVFLILSERYQMPRRELMYFVMPVGFASVMISVLFGARPALFAGLFVSIVTALQMVNPFQMFFNGLLISAGGAMAVRKVQNSRTFFLRAFYGTWLTALLTVLIFYLKIMDKDFSLKVQDRETLRLIFWMTVFPFVTGLLTASLAQIGVYLQEMLFDVTTPMSLQAFYDFNHPLLKDLQLKAPGTYHHCLMVSLLAEKAAEEAGLDPVKARVCGMFHDVGKLVQPEYFIENSPGRDMHKDQDPKMSAIIIRSHVAKHGPELARKYKLKHLLYDTITQHHGNDVIAYFYKKEQQLHPGENILQTDFRYPGPLPSDKEICLVMLADCCEAASRSLEKPTEETLSQLVNDIFRGKIRNGQLDNSELTMHELTIIRNSIINSLKTMFHGRIAYPKDDRKDEDDLFMAAGKDVSAS